MLAGSEELIDARMADAQLHQLFMGKLADFKETIDAKELDILEQRLLSEEPATLQAIGDKYGITKERVRQIENRLIGKIKKYMEAELPDFKHFELPPPADPE
jgi:RNA polymerase sigma-32 factor